MYFFHFDSTIIQSYKNNLQLPYFVQFFLNVWPFLHQNNYWLEAIVIRVICPILQVLFLIVVIFSTTYQITFSNVQEWKQIWSLSNVITSVFIIVNHSLNSVNVIRHFLFLPTHYCSEKRWFLYIFI